MILDEEKSRVLLNAKISSLKLNDVESSLKWCEWWFDDGKENVFLDFEKGGGLEDRMISNGFLLLISWEDKSNVLLGPNIFFELGDELKGRWFSFGWFANSEEDEWKSGWRISTLEL